jgi:hypothetical protein
MHESMTDRDRKECLDAFLEYSRLSLVNDSLPAGPSGALAPAGPRVLFLYTIKADAAVS